MLAAGYHSGPGEDIAEREEFFAFSKRLPSRGLETALETTT
jgi:hypothetical protein